MPQNFGTRRRRIPVVSLPDAQPPPPDGSVPLNARPLDIRNWLAAPAAETTVTIVMDRDVRYAPGVTFQFYLNAETLPRTATTTDQTAPRHFNAELDFLPGAGDTFHFPVGSLPARTPSDGGASGTVTMNNTDAIQPTPQLASADFTNLAASVQTLDNAANKTVFCLQGWTAGMTIVADDGLNTHPIISGRPADDEPANDNPTWLYTLGPPAPGVGVPRTIHFPAAALRSYAFEIPSLAADIVAAP